MFLIELLYILHIDDTVAHLVVVTILSGTVITVTHTVTAIKVADVCHTLGGMYSRPVLLGVVAIGVGRIVFLQYRLKVVFARAGCEE